MADYGTFYAIEPFGGTSGAMDRIDGALLSDKDHCTVIGHTDEETYHYTLDATSGAAEVTAPVPTIIAPDNNAGDKRWLLTNPALGDASAFLTSLGITSTVNQYTAQQYYDANVLVNSAGVVTVDMNLEGYATLTLAANVTDFTFSNTGAAKIVTVLVTENGSGGHSLVWNAMVDFAAESDSHNDAADAQTLFWFFSTGSKILAKKVWEDN